MSCWINGHKNNQINITDRSISFGDGCFTTIFCFNQKAIMLKEHIIRLKNDCKCLKISQPNWNKLNKHIKYICKLQNKNKFIIKIIISRGNGTRGYSSKLINNCTTIIMIMPFPKHYKKLQNNGVKLFISSISLSRNKLLSGIKHLNRLEQVLIYQEIDKKGYDEAIVLDTSGIIIECCTSNIFWRIGLKIYTPILSHSGINGIMRQKIIKILSKSYFHLEEIKAFPKILLKSDEVIICNSLMPIFYVNYIKFKSFKITKKYYSKKLFNYLNFYK
ncbi:aminodeoxychorismate lyase [Candidatus Providencia siddallii]|uniref:Aminodeoxychorismate lyase n=1 Tax=Candidatus Providencia siddallii TaxID=1715285 RepID=A0ABM9NP71_9GAMM